MNPAYLLALVISASAAPAPPAKPPESLAIVAVDGCSQELTASSARLLRQALSAQPDSTVLSEDETLRPLGGHQRGSLADAERLIAAARLEFQEHGGVASLEKTLDEAMAILISLPPSESYRWRTLRDLASFQAMLYYYVGRRPDAEKALERILRVEPTFEPDHDSYSPDMWKLAEKVRKRLKEQTSATVSISSRPGGVPIAVDGRLMGKAPITLELPAGEYRVEALFGKERTLARTVRASGLTSVELDQSFDGAVRVASGPCFATNGDREARLVPLVKLSRFLGVSQVVGLWQEEPASGEVYLTAAVVDGKSSQELREAKVKVSAGQPTVELIGKLAQFISKGSAGPPVEPVVTKPRPANLAPRDEPLAGAVRQYSQTSSSQKTWGLAVGGAGLAAVAAGAIFDALAHSAYEDEKKAGASGDAAAYRAAMSSADSRGRTANILYVAGAVGVGVGTYLYLTGRSDAATLVSVAPMEGGAVAMISGVMP
jgi:hypothetical protein